MFVHTNYLLTHILTRLSRPGQPTVQRPIMVVGRSSTGRSHYLDAFAQQMCCSERRGPFQREAIEDQLCQCDICQVYRSGDCGDCTRLVGSERIDEIRSTLGSMGRVPTVMPVRVMMLENLHRYPRGTLDALLKFFEEPPPDLMILATARSARSLPSSIASRFMVMRQGKPAKTQIDNIRERAGRLPLTPEQKEGPFNLINSPEVATSMGFEDRYKELFLSDDFLDLRKRAGEFLDRIEASVEHHVADVLEFFVEWLEWRIRSSVGAGTNTNFAKAMPVLPGLLRRSQDTLGRYLYDPDSANYIDVRKQLTSLVVGLNMIRRIASR